MKTETETAYFNKKNLFLHLYKRPMIDKIKEYIAEADAFQTDNKETLEQFRIKYLGSKGLLKDLFSEFKNVPNDQKKEFGQVINTLKTTCEDKIKTIQEALESKEENVGIYGDLTRPAEPVVIGSRHPISLVKNQIIDIFSTIGFNVSEGPEIEDDWHNFTALNLPEYHQHSIAIKFKNYIDNKFFCTSFEEIQDAEWPGASTKGGRC
jgi:phenylalanyl-tRNA synthetase alpha chain